MISCRFARTAKPNLLRSTRASREDRSRCSGLGGDLSSSARTAAKRWELVPSGIRFQGEGSAPGVVMLRDADQSVDVPGVGRARRRARIAGGGSLHVSEHRQPSWTCRTRAGSDTSVGVECAPDDARAHPGSLSQKRCRQSASRRCGCLAGRVFRCPVGQRAIDGPRTLRRRRGSWRVPSERGTAASAQKLAARAEFQVPSGRGDRTD